MIKRLRHLLLLITLTLCNVTYAMMESQDDMNNMQMQTLVYKPDNTYKYVGFFGIATYMTLEEGESVDRLILGDQSGWQIEIFDNRIFLKPKTTQKSVLKTNAIMMTSSLNGPRLYKFVLDAEKPDSIDDSKVSVETRFIYPYQHKDLPPNYLLDEVNDIVQDTSMELNAPAGPFAAELSKVFSLFSGLMNPANINTNYLLLGEKRIEPLQVFDDGKFTAMKFRQGGLNEMPVVLAVAEDGTEANVNLRFRGDYMIIEQVSPRFTLRSGNDKVCVFNSSIPFKFKGNQKQ